LGVAATLTTLLALPSSSKPTIALPSARQAEAAFVTGLLANPDTAKAAAPLAVAMAPASAVKVAIANYAFAPAALTVKVGQTVTWTNEDSAPHTVTVASGPQTFSSPELKKGDTYSFTFTRPGTYSYYCAVHPSMTAAVTVTGTSATGTPTPSTSTSASPSSAPSSSSSTPTSSASPTGSMSMPAPPPSGSSSCAVTYALQTLLTHINTAHLDESPGQQVSDILDLDTYIGNHLALVQRWAHQRLEHPALDVHHPRRHCPSGRITGAAGQGHPRRQHLHRKSPRTGRAHDPTDDSADLLTTTFALFLGARTGAGPEERPTLSGG
jgi:amicyanin